MPNDIRTYLRPHGVRQREHPPTCVMLVAVPSPGARGVPAAKGWAGAAPVIGTPQELGVPPLVGPIEVP